MILILHVMHAYDICTWYMHTHICSSYLHQILWLLYYNTNTWICYMHMIHAYDVRNQHTFIPAQRAPAQQPRAVFWRPSACWVWHGTASAAPHFGPLSGSECRAAAAACGPACAASETLLSVFIISCTYYCVRVLGWRTGQSTENKGITQKIRGGGM